MSNESRPIDRLRVGIRSELARLASKPDVNVRDVLQFSVLPMLGELVEVLADWEDADAEVLPVDLVARVIGLLAELLRLARPALSEEDARHWSEAVKEVAGELVSFVEEDELKALLPIVEGPTTGNPTGELK